MSASALPAGTPVWTTNWYPKMPVGTAAVTVTVCERDSHAEKVTVRLEDGQEKEIASYSVAAMLPEEVPAWAKNEGETA